MASIIIKKFHCSDCGKEFSKEKKLLSHFKVHTTTKTYMCEVCKLTFSQKSQYKKHIKTHFEKGTCSCPKCGKVFVRHSWLKRHLNLQCNDANQNSKFICRDCGKMYDSLAGVRSHLRKGKHVVPLFKCYFCEWICSCSEALFFHVLQHKDINIIIVSMDNEQKLECFSTSKIREKVDIGRFKPDSTTENNKDIDQALSRSILEDEELENLNLTYETENTELQNMMQNSMVSALKETSNEEEISQCKSENSEALHDDSLKNASRNSENDIDMVKPNPESKETIDSPSLIGSVKAVLPQDGVSNDCVSQKGSTSVAENYSCASQQYDENLSLIDNMISKKMPKLLDLYPEEELSITDNTCTVGDNSLMLHNEVPIPHLITNDLQAEPIANRHNEIIPYATPLVNTMILPPLFLIHNTLPMSPTITRQNTYLMGDTLIDNQPMSNVTPATTIMDELKSMTDEITVPRKKKKCQSKFAKKFPDTFKFKTNEVSNYMKQQKQHTSNSQLSLQNVMTVNDKIIMSHPENSFLPDYQPILPQENGIQRLKDLVNLTEQMNGTNTDGFRKENSNKCQTRNVQDESHSWEILVEGDESEGKIVGPMSVSFKNQSGACNKGKLNTSSEFFNNKKSQEQRDGKHKASTDIPSMGCQHQQHRSKEGIGVEDYIRKFIWY